MPPSKGYRKTKLKPDTHCRKCGVELDDANRALQKGDRRICKECRKAYFAEWHRTHTDRYRVRNWVQQYGITPTEYKQMLEGQDGVCAICFNGNRSGKLLAVDHDHITGAIRGLLCSACNAGVGMFKDDERLMLSAVRYLKQYKSVPLVPVEEEQ